MADFIALCKCNKLLLQEKPATIFFIFVPKSLKMKLLIIEKNETSIPFDFGRHFFMAIFSKS
jgi:hypothetical protein